MYKFLKNNSWLTKFPWSTKPFDILDGVFLKYWAELNPGLNWMNRVIGHVRFSTIRKGCALTSTEIKMYKIVLLHNQQ